MIACITQLCNGGCVCTFGKPRRPRRHAKGSHTIAFNLLMSSSKARSLKRVIRYSRDNGRWLYAVEWKPCGYTFSVA